MKHLRDRLSKILAEEGLIEAGDMVVLALSGGPDSVSLYYVLTSLREAFDFSLTAVHVNHGLREESAEDCAYVKELCELGGVEIDIYDIDVNALAEEKGLTVEEAGRQARYDAFDETARKIEARGEFEQEQIKIATAHTKNDQIETLLMRIIRGTGPAGLAGIPVKRKSSDGYEIIRPLLDVSKSEIDFYCFIQNI